MENGEKQVEKNCQCFMGVNGPLSICTFSSTQVSLPNAIAPSAHTIKWIPFKFLVFANNHSCFCIHHIKHAKMLRASLSFLLSSQSLSVTLSPSLCLSHSHVKWKFVLMRAGFIRMWRIRTVNKRDISKLRRYATLIYDSIYAMIIFFLSLFFIVPVGRPNLLAKR